MQNEIVSLLGAAAIALAAAWPARATAAEAAAAEAAAAEAPTPAAAIAPGGATEPGDERNVTFEVGTGLEYDSNVAILELDTATNAGDAAALLDFGVGYDKRADGPFDVNTGYNFSQSLHEDFDEFDVRIHRGSSTLTYDLGRVDVGTTLQYARAELDGDQFLTLAQVSPYLSKLVGKRLFLRFAYAYSDKDFASNPARDAVADSLSADAYVFVNGLRSYLVFGYRYDDEDAAARQFDYAGHKLNAQWSKRIAAGSRELTLKTHLRYETRDYAGATPSIGAPRQDDRLQVEASLDIPAGERVLIHAAYKHADNRSNLPSVNFDENVVSIGVIATF